MRYRLGAALAGLAIAPVASAQAQSAFGEVNRLEPAGDWQVRQTEESCSLQRSFGRPGHEAALAFYTYGPDNSYRVTLTGPDVPRNVGRARVSEIGFGPEPEMAAIVAIDSRSGENGMLSFHLTGRNPAFRYYRGWNVPGRFENPEPELQWPGDLSQMTVENGDLPRMSLQLGDMAAPLHQLELCQLALAASWGWDQAKLDRIETVPKLIEGGPTVEQMGMPPEQVLNRISLIAQLRVAVDELGQGSDCVVQSPVLERRAQRALCRPFESGVKFEPARDALGNAVPGLFRLHYTYFIFD